MMMGRIALTSAAMILLAACGDSIIQAPPERFQIATSVAITFDTEAKISAKCAGLVAEQFGSSVACADVGAGIITMPNPCIFNGDFYAGLLCHELGHHNKWPANHPG